MDRRHFFSFFLLLSVPCFASAQEASTGTGAQTGTGTALEETTTIKTMRMTRTKDFHAKMLAFVKIDSQFRSHAETFRRKRAELWRTCREDLRRANRDTKFPTVLRCFRGTVTLEKDFLVDESDWLSVMPGVPSAIRSVTVSRLDLLREALNTVLLGIDGKVYATTDDILEARKNLLEKYRIPFATSLLTARAEMLLTWNQELILTLDSTFQNDGVTLDEEEKRAWQDARKCLLETERSLLAYHNADSPPIATDIGVAMTSLHSCSSKILSLPLVESSSSSRSSLQP